MSKTQIPWHQIIQLPKDPTVAQAVEYMKTAQDIVDWNLKRARVIRAVGKQKFLNDWVVSNDSYVSQIDASGLVVQVLSQVKSNNHKPFKYGSKS